MGTELQTTNRKTPCSLLLSDNDLASLVNDHMPGIRQRLMTPEELERAEALLPQYERALQPAAPERIEESVAMLALAYPAMRTSVDEAAARLKLYTAGLSDVPADILPIACDAAIKELTFFPSVAELRNRCKGWALRQWRYDRLRHLIAQYDGANPSKGQRA